MTNKPWLLVSNGTDYYVCHLRDLIPYDFVVERFETKQQAEEKLNETRD